MNETKRSMQELWQDCKFITKELQKFTSPEDLSLFSDLLNQRETLLSLIKEDPDENNFIKSDEGQALIREVITLDEELRQKVVAAKNILKKNMEVSTAYEGFLGDNAAIGSRFDTNK